VTTHEQLIIQPRTPNSCHSDEHCNQRLIRPFPIYTDRGDNGTKFRFWFHVADAGKTVEKTLSDTDIRITQAVEKEASVNVHLLIEALNYLKKDGIWFPRLTLT